MAGAQLGAGHSRCHLTQHAPQFSSLQVKSGVRALPPRGAQGSIPFAGRVPVAGAAAASSAAAAGGGDEGAGVAPAGGNWWFVGGLGARGLVYHAWLGRLVAAAVAAGDEGLLPPELLRWRRQQ